MPCLEVTTVASCTVRCTYCPQDALKEAYPKDTAHRLTLDTWRTCLGKVPPHVRIDFSGFVEPWLNPDCTQFLREALERGYSVGIYTTMQGMRVPEAVCQLLTDHAKQVEVLCLHLPDPGGNMTGHKDDEAWRHALRCFLILRGLDAFPRFELMTMDSQGETPVVPVGRLLAFVGVDRAGSLDRGAVAGQPLEAPVAHHEPVGCSYTPWYDQNVLLPNGDVVLCCEDYGLKVKLGNLLTQRYYELFSSEVLAKMRAANMQPGPTGTLCKRCSRATRYATTPAARQRWVEVPP
jgi:hypothetical protein